MWQADGCRGTGCGARTPDELQRKAVLAMVCKALGGLHNADVIHGSLTPDNIIWFSANNAMKITEFSCWARKGGSLLLHPHLRYAPPEVRAPARPLHALLDL